MIDRFIAQMPAEADGDLMLCRGHGVAYQADRTHRVEYGDEYFAKCAGYQGQTISRSINAGRIWLVSEFVGKQPVLDIGVGSGEFVALRPNTWGYDVNPRAAEWLERHELWDTPDRIPEVAGVTMWDVIEHVPDPGEYLDRIARGAFLFCSIPVFYGLGGIRLSKHYRPGEHLYYWTEEGFVSWLRNYGFRLERLADFEIQAGRESILSFAFRRVR